MFDDRRVPLVFGALIVVCVMGAVLIDRPVFAIAGWALAFVLAVGWMAVALRAWRADHQTDVE